MNGPVHFIYLGGPFLPQHARAIVTAKVHSKDVVLHCATRPQGDLPSGISLEPLYLNGWLRKHPIKLANVKDLFCWKALLDDGGLYLDLDTISLRPVWDLIGDDAQMCVGREYPEGDNHPNPFNSACVIGRKNSPILSLLYGETFEILRSGEATWGAVGPHLLSRTVARFPDEFSVAPYRAFNGWSYHAIGEFYADPRDPGEPCRVIHLYSSDHQVEFSEDTWTPTT